MTYARPFMEVSVLATGAQLFTDRFPGQTVQDGGAPDIAAWRCTLTALSQSHNLYFVAYAERIFVYTPLFPTQFLPPEPVLILNVPPTPSGLHGDIDPRRPHAINNILVQLLGTEEALACVRDDGDVDVFFTRHIVQAIERRSQPGNTLGADASDVKPIFQRNVGRSAWGLAIHSEARMIAVSSNAHEITVFTFALLQRDVVDLDESMGLQDEETYYSTSGPKPPSDRTRNDIRIIKNGPANIPHIAFCNTGHDPHGRWLASTDITGAVRTWDVHALTSRTEVQTQTYERHDYTYDRFNAGWGVMFLDPRSFKQTKSLHQALGLPPDLAKLDTSIALWDLSSTTEQVPRTSRNFQRPHRPVEVIDGNFVDPIAGHPQYRDDGLDGLAAGLQNGRGQHSLQSTDTLEEALRAIIQSRNLHVAREAQQAQEARLTPRSPSRQSSASLPQGNVDVDDEDDDVDDDDRSVADGGVPLSNAAASAHDRSGLMMRNTMEEEVDMTADNASEEGDSEDLHQASNDESGQDEDEEEDEEDEDAFIDQMYSGLPPKAPNIAFQSMNGLCDVPCPVLHISVRALYLFQPSSFNSAKDHLPLITLSELFKQDLAPRDFHLDSFERCNMHAYIPSLGVVIVATQKGRVAVLSLTQTRSDGREDVGWKSHGHRRIFAFRVDHLLPFASQEQAGYRPSRPLHGIAVGPVQGCEGLPDELKRWRLMIMYQDHSVLAYEIGRPAKDRVEVREPVVI